MTGKTYPQLTAATTPLADTDVAAVYRSPGPLKQTPLSALADYIKTFFAASGGSALVGFIASAAGAVATTLQARGRKVIYASDFGVTGDGTDEAAKMRSAIAAAAGKALYLPNPTSSFILCNSSLGTIPTKTRIYGESKRGTVIRAGFGSGTLMTLADGVQLENLTLDGNSQACKGVEMLGAAGNQSMNEVRVINFANDCIYFEKNAGSGFNAVGLETYRSDGASGSGNYAIRIEDVSGGLGPKHFFGLETGGNCAFSFGGANNIFVVGSTIADCLFSVNNQSVHIIGCRTANATTMTILGSSVSIVGGNVNPQIILGSGVQSCFIAPAAANNGIVDNSGVATNQIFDGVTQVYTPVVTTTGAGGGTVTIGNGDISGSYCRTGTQIAGNINFTVGSTTVFNGGGGTLRFSLPFTPISISLQRQVQAEIIDATTPAAPYMAGGLVQQAVSYLTLIRDTTGLVSSTSPIAVPASGDTYRLSFLYNL
jgi:hypothetical protein